MWLVISPTDGSVDSVAFTHDEAFSRANRLATLRAKLVAGPTLRYKVRRLDVGTVNRNPLHVPGGTP